MQKKKISYCFAFILFVTFSIYADTQLPKAVTATLPASELINYDDNSNSVKNLIEKALILTQENLTYLYGSADPERKGMDCSGTIHYLLTAAGLKNVPRQADQFYVWARDKGKLHLINNNNFNSIDFSKLQPGDLLFWSGTYSVKREANITHVMIYLGKNKQHQPLMFGASDGRTYQGKAMYGVSVYDFKLPNANSKAHFVGYSCIPELTCEKS